jgi:hypothetical protein
MAALPRDVPLEYVRLGLRFDRLESGFVDAYTGDPRVRAEVADETAPTPQGLRDQARDLLRELDGSDLPEERAAFLRGQLTGLECTARKMSGEPVGFVDEVAAYFQVDVTLGDPDVYAAAHADLDALLPGDGTLAERYYRSRVAINADLPHRLSGLPHLVAHESYPGHHTEHCRKEQGLVERADRVEHTIFLVNTPECLMAEGLADLGVQASVGEGWGPWAAEILGDLGLRFDGHLAERLAAAAAPLNRVRQDAAVLLHDRGADADEVSAYLQRWSLVNADRATQQIRFLTDPLWRAYISTYVEGYDLLSRWLSARPAEQPVADRFLRLLDEPLTPRAVTAELRAA